MGGHASGWAVRRIHNACVIIEVGDVRVLTDPWLSRSWAFRGRAPVTAAGLGLLTAVIGSHWVRDHWNIADLTDYPDKDVPLYVCADHMVESANAVGFVNAERVEWGRSLELSRHVRLDVIEEHTGRGNATNNYALVSDDARVFFGGEMLDLDALRRHMETTEPYDVAIGPVNGVKFMGRQLTTTAIEMVEACRILGARTLVPIHDEHRGIPFLLNVTSSARDLGHLEHSGIRVVELELGGRFAEGREIDPFGLA